MKTLIAIPAAILALCLTSCTKQELPVPAATAQATQTAAPHLGQRVGPEPVSALAGFCEKKAPADR